MDYSQWRLDDINRLKHENLLKIIGICTKEVPIYIVTEFMFYGNMERFILEVDEVEVLMENRLRMAIQVSSAMEYLESFGFIHG